jgi:Zn-dependent peptidase ImmA (M78 family)/DNA-binding XRE family transcriptional regulator
MGIILNNETLKLARTYLGYSQKEFSEKIGVSQAVVSNIEKNNKPLTDDLVAKLDDFSFTFFAQKMSQPLLKVHYRASSTVAKKLTDLFESRLQIISNNITTFLETVDIPENRIPQKDLEDFELDAEYLANEVRQYFNLGNRPIENLVNLLEKNGVVVYFFDYDFISSQNKNFDGVSFYVKGVPVILINDKIQNARKIFTLAHELGHLIMHNHNDFFISKDRDIEKEANVFASEFIAPKNALRGEFSRLTLEKLFDLKAIWKLSIAALLYKAKEMTLSEDQYRRWITRLAAYRKHEPNDIDIQKPQMLKKVFSLCEADLGGKQHFLEELGLSEKIFKEIYSTLLEKDKPRLRVII